MKQMDWSKIEGFDWDEANVEKNWEKHRVTIKEAEEIFANEPIRYFADKKHSKIEKRIVAYGITNGGRKLTVVFTIRNNTLRVISARDQSRKERNKYEKQKK